MRIRGERPDLLGRAADDGKPERRVGQEPLADLGQHHPLVFAPEQRRAELSFERADRIGNGGLRDAEFAPGGGKAEQPPGGLENRDRVERDRRMAHQMHEYNLCKR